MCNLLDAIFDTIKPLSPKLGQIYVDKYKKNMHVWNGNEWEVIKEIEPEIDENGFIIYNYKRGDNNETRIC